MDNFGHRYLSGVGKQLENAIRSKLGCKVRSIELNTMQRCASHVSSKTDIDEAEQVATAAVEAALNGETGRVMAIIRVKEKPYTVKYVSVAANEIANKVKYVPKEWINERGNNLSDDVIDYILPLIQGEQDIRYKDGLPVHFTLDK